MRRLRVALSVSGSRLSLVKMRTCTPSQSSALRNRCPRSGHACPSPLAHASRRLPRHAGPRPGCPIRGRFCVQCASGAWLRLLYFRCVCTVQLRLCSASCSSFHSSASMSLPYTSPHCSHRLHMHISPWRCVLADASAVAPPQCLHWYSDIVLPLTP